MNSRCTRTLLLPGLGAGLALIIFAGCSDNHQQEKSTHADKTRPAPPAAPPASTSLPAAPAPAPASPNTEAPKIPDTPATRLYAEASVRLRPGIQSFSEWLFQLGNEDDIATALRGAGAALGAEGKRADLDALCQRLPDSKHRWALLTGYVAGVGTAGKMTVDFFQKDPALLALLPKASRANLIGIAANSAAFIDHPETSAEMIAVNKAFSNVSAAKPLGRRWATKNPQEALQWVDTIPTGNFKNLAFAGCISSWVRTDPAAASNYVTTITDDYTRDLAAKELVGGIRGTDPQRAAAWAESIKDPGLKSAAQAMLTP